MTDPKTIATMDQLQAGMEDIVAPTTFKAYESFLKSGFSENQALELACAWMESTFCSDRL